MSETKEQAVEKIKWETAKRLLDDLTINNGDYSEAVYERINKNYLGERCTFKQWRDYWKERNREDIKLQKAINVFVDKKDLAEQFIKLQPIYYESKNVFYVWDTEECYWELKDETDILNLISKYSYANTINSKEKNEILESLKQVGRQHKPDDIKPTWVQFGKRIYDVSNGEDFESTSKYFLKNPIAWKVGESEETPTIDALMKSWVAEEDIESLYELIAFSVIPDYFIHSFWFLYSEPGKGKSTFVNLLIKFLGKKNCVATSIDRINNNTRFETINWHNKLLITLSEVSDVNDLKNSGTINQATGQDPVPAERKGAGQFEFINYGKFVYPTNKLLKVSSDDGFGRRVRVKKFITRFEKERDVIAEIPDYEFENLARKSLRIGKRLLENRKFTGDTTISERMAGYQEISKTHLERFIGKECDTSDYEAKILFDDFCAKYMREKEVSDSKIMIGKKLRKLGYFVKNENWKVKDETSSDMYPVYKWESGTRIHGIKWRVTQQKF